MRFVLASVRFRRPWPFFVSSHPLFLSCSSSATFPPILIVCSLHPDKGFLWLVSSSLCSTLSSCPCLSGALLLFHHVITASCNIYIFCSPHVFHLLPSHISLHPSGFLFFFPLSHYHHAPFPLLPAFTPFLLQKTIAIFFTDHSLCLFLSKLAHFQLCPCFKALFASPHAPPLSYSHM